MERSFAAKKWLRDCRYGKVRERKRCPEVRLPGFCIDAVVQTEKHIYLFEFKLDDDKSALSQIKEKEYFKKFLQSKKPITMIRMTFDSNKGQISDWKAEDLPM